MVRGVVRVQMGRKKGVQWSVETNGQRIGQCSYVSSEGCSVE